MNSKMRRGNWQWAMGNGSDGDPVAHCPFPIALLPLAILLLALLPLASCDQAESPLDASEADASALASDPNLEMLSILEFDLVDQDGSPVTREIFEGNITVLDFFFTHCPFVCVPMSKNMLHAQSQLADARVRFVSVSVDPERDTPERLREYAAGLGANLSTWTFLTGDFEAVSRMVREGLLLAELTPNPDQPIALPGGETMSNIMHPSHFILVGPDVEIIALHRGTDRESVNELIERARRAAEEHSNKGR